MVQNFGYAQRDDGTSEVYHYGQSWRGPFFIRLIFQTHARYVIYATEQHLNSPRFLAQDEDEEDDLVAQRHNIPKHLLGQFLDGLEVDVQAKLGESARALATLGQAPKDAAELAALRAQVASLESTLRDLREASLRRQQTAAAAPKRALRRATTALERRDTGVESRRRPKPEGSARASRPRAPAPRGARRGGGRRGRQRRRDGRDHGRRRQAARPPRDHRRRARARRGPLARGGRLRRRAQDADPAPRDGHRGVGGGLRALPPVSN